MPKPDYAHKWTDKQLAALEKRIAAEFKQAAEDLTDTVNAYFEALKKRDAEMAAKAEAGEITEQAYKQWRLAQIGRGKRFEALRDKVAERYTNAHEVAVAYANDATPGIYTLNRNYAAYTIEQISDKADFTLWDEQTVRRLIEEQPGLMPYYPPKRALKRGIDLDYGKKQITASITSSILQGKSISRIADDLQQRMESMNRASAIRTARTSVTAAQNAGRMDSYAAAEKMGIKLKKQWLATLDGRTRHAHAMLDGQTAETDKPFNVDGYEIMYPGDASAPGYLVYNCFVGETQIASDSKIVRSYKHTYNGDLIEVKTACGINFTCTPNHPILTPYGWVAAALLHNGDNLVVTFDRNTGGFRRNSNIKHIHSSMKALYNSLHCFGLMSRDSTLRINFHGDIPTTNVEVITKKWLLRNNGNSGVRQSINKFSLKNANKPLMSQCPLMKHFGSVCKAAFRFISGKCQTLALLWRSLLHPNVHRFRTVSGRDIGVTQDTVNNLTAKSETLGKVLDGFSGEIAVDKVVSVKIIPSGQTATHVYNLQTQNGYYFVNSSISQSGTKCNGIFAIAKNCRCTLIAALDGVDTSSGCRRAREPETGEWGTVSNTTYAEWAGLKKESGSTLDASNAPAKTWQVYGLAERQKYSTSENDTVMIYALGREKRDDGTWTDIKRLELGVEEIPANEDKNLLIVTGLPDKTTFGQFDDTPNYILTDGRMALNKTAKNENTRIQISAAVENEIYALAGLRQDGHFYRVIGSEKEIGYIKKGTVRKSKNHFTGETEDGLSVWEVPKYGGGKLVEVTGEVVSTGSDGEPMLDISTIKFVRVVDDWLDMRKKGIEKFKKKYKWTDAQIDQALKGDYKLNR